MFGGGIWPVVQRELRAGARRPINHWLRVAGALGGVIVFWMSASAGPITSVGGQIFFGIHHLLMLLIVCVVPAITADCIARERREGTLGLLLLTPLRSSEIVLGKVLVQMLKALTFWLAIVPVLAIPFLLGGVARREVLSQLGAELCVGIYCMAAGIIATSLTEKRATAFALAFAFAATLVFGLTDERWADLLRLQPRPVVFVSTGRYRVFGASPYIFNPLAMQSPAIPPQFAPQPVPRRLAPMPRRGGFPPRSPLIGPPPVRPVISLWPVAESLLLASLILWGTIRFAGYCVEQSWKDKTPSSRKSKWTKISAAPIVFKQGLRRKLRRTLEWNPIAWLQQYSWKLRLITWALCLVFTVLICMASAPGNTRSIAEQESIVLAILAAVYTYAGVNGFLQEKKTGALELILVTPLTVNEIIFGRVWGLWRQFFPAALMSAFSYYAFRSIDMRSGYNIFAIWNPVGDRYGMGYWSGYYNEGGMAQEFAVIIGFFALPFYATLAALRFRNIVLAAACTWLLFLAAPLVGGLFAMAVVNLFEAADAIPAYYGFEPGPGWFYPGVIVGHAVFVTLAFRNLRRGLSQRDYSF
jgi:ABC-type transport system involved in cytochrome c biogenesis permease component